MFGHTIELDIFLIWESETGILVGMEMGRLAADHAVDIRTLKTREAHHHSLAANSFAADLLTGLISQ